MKSLLTILSFLILVSCKQNLSENYTPDKGVDSLMAAQDTVVQESTDELHDSDYGIYHFTFSVHKSLPRFALKFHVPDRKIYIYANPDEGGLPFQEIPLSEDINYDQGHFAENPEANFTFQDYNFDGFRDISVIRIAGTSNLFSDIYLYDTKARKFFVHVGLSEKTSLEIDTLNQILKFHNAGGMGGGWYSAGVIEWRNQQPVVIREEEQTSSENDPEIFIRTVQTFSDGAKMKIASKVRIERADNDHEKQYLLEGEWTEFDRYPNLIFAETHEQVQRVDCRSGSCD